METDRSVFWQEWTAAHQQASRRTRRQALTFGVVAAELTAAIAAKVTSSPRPLSEALYFTGLGTYVGTLLRFPVPVLTGGALGLGLDGLGRFFKILPLRKSKAPLRLQQV